MKRTHDDDDDDASDDVFSVIPDDAWIGILAVSHTYRPNKYPSLFSIACVNRACYRIAQYAIRQLYARIPMREIVDVYRCHPLRAYHVLLTQRVAQGPVTRVDADILLRHVCDLHSRQLLTTTFVRKNADGKMITPTYEMNNADRTKWVNAIMARHKHSEHFVYDTISALIAIILQVTHTLQLHCRTDVSWSSPVMLRLMVTHDVETRTDTYSLGITHPSLPPPRYDQVISILE